jgi:hypothetical protein
LVPIQPPAPAQYPPQPPRPKERPLEHDERTFTLGVGPLILGNVHWLDQIGDQRVTVGKRHGYDERYPGFIGLDATIGLMLDLRYRHLIGLEVDLFRQNDRGSGVINVNDAGNLCYLPSVATPYKTARYRLTIGQYAWHLPILVKLSIPGRKVIVEDDEREVDREFIRWFTTLAFGPELVFPENARFEVSPESGLDYPVRATASTYLMYTGALGYERRLSDSHDIRLLLSLRGSYNPKAGDSAMKRGQYAVVDSTIVPIAYRSEWRYQAALTVGLGWYW